MARGSWCRWARSSAVLGAVFGATVLGAIAHLILIGFALAGPWNRLAITAYHGRRLVLRWPRADKRLKA